MSQQINFIYDPHQENISILGMQGSGKTTKAKDVLDQIPNIPRWIWSPQKALQNYGGYGQPITEITELKRGAYIFTGSFSPENFDKFCDRAMMFSNLVIVVDDVHEFVTKQKIPKPFSRLINSGRNRGVVGIYITPSPNLVNNVILQSSQHIFAFKFNLETQITWMANNYFGVDAWVLLPEHLRQKKPLVSELAVLPKHSFLYRKDTDVANTLILGSVPNEG